MSKVTDCEVFVQKYDDNLPRLRRLAFHTWLETALSADDRKDSLDQTELFATDEAVALQKQKQGGIGEISHEIWTKTATDMSAC